LRELELDTIKIDRTLVGQMLAKPQVARIVKAIVSLGHALASRPRPRGFKARIRSAAC
jgi:EAL domain-containing protein (putative c-di-GMP-specific phosphodiesterase class I)